VKAANNITAMCTLIYRMLSSPVAVDANIDIVLGVSMPQLI